MKKQKQDVTIKLQHLHPKVQEIIDSGSFLDELGGLKSRSIRNLRRLRTVGGPLALAASLSLQNQIAVSGSLLNTMLGGIVIKRLHKHLVNAIKENGLLNTKYEGHYPDNWMSPAIVAKTHPSFHVKGNGDIVFHKTTRMEYFRVKFQDRFKVAAWRWRACLEPPTAPKKVRDLVKAQLNRIAQQAKRLTPRPFPRPVPVPASYKKRKKRTGKPMLRFA